MARRNIQTHCDRVIANLDPESRDYFDQLMREHANATTIHRWLLQFDSELKYDSVLTYCHRLDQESEQVRRVNEAIAGLRGINTVDAHAASLAAVVLLVQQLQEILEFNPTEPEQRLTLEKIKPTVISNLVDLLREQRQSANQLHTLKRLEDRRELILSGAYRLAEICANLTRDTPHFETVKSVIDGAIARLEAEA